MTRGEIRQRLVAILAADVAGYSRLMAQDERATVAALDATRAVFRSVIEATQGRVIDMAGDSVLAIFETAVGAIEAAIAIQNLIESSGAPTDRRMRYRISVHLGDVMEKADGTVYGDGINVAARLQAMAAPGGIVVSDAIHAVVRKQVAASFEDMGEQSAKNIAQPLRVFRVMSAVKQAPSLTDRASIAVLPFANLSGDPAQDYFADGLSEELLNVLVKIRTMRVTSRTSAFSFRGKSIDVPTIAQRLGVSYVLEGSVRKSGNRVRVSAQLIDVVTDSHLWSNTYDRELSDIFSVQDDIAQSVVMGLRAALPRERPSDWDIASAKADVNAAVKGRAGNAEAYQLYLQGRFLEGRLNRDDTRKAISHYAKALEVDPSYAVAWVGLSRAYRRQADDFGDLPINEGFKLARDAASRALELEPELAEAHAALGIIRVFHDWDWKGADQSLRRAMELAPGDAGIMASTAMLIGILGDMEEAIALLRHAVNLDPLNAQIHTALGTWCLRAGRVSEGAVCAERVLELDPTRGFSHTLLSWARQGQGRLAEALAAAEQESIDSMRLMGTALTLYALGRHAESDRALEELIAKHAAHSAVQIAEIHAYRGEFDSVFAWLDRAYTQRDAGLGFLNASPLLRVVHSDPRWRPFVKRMGLSD